MSLPANRIKLAGLRAFSLYPSKGSGPSRAALEGFANRFEPPAPFGSLEAIISVRFIPAVFLTLSTLAGAPAPNRLDLGWPTPNPAWADGKGIEAFIQPTVSGDPQSGCFGCVRDNGFQFHEGLDLKPVARDRRGEPEDEVFAVLPGIVRHVNLRPGESSYGRYIVVEHTGVTPSVYSLYAHLARVMPVCSTTM